MEAPFYNRAGEQSGTLQLDEYIFGIEPNIPVMHQAMVRQLANARLGTQNTRGRGEVAGSTRKLFRQKGTGRARQGSVRAPHRKGGGVAHGPHPRKYTKSMPRKMRRLAVRSALSAKQAENQLRFFDAVSFEQPRTKDMIAFLGALSLDGKTLIVTDNQDKVLLKSANNLNNVKTLHVMYLNVVDLLNYDYVLISRPAVEIIHAWLGNTADDTAVEAGAEEVA